jgi:hypothetical protein
VVKSQHNQTCCRGQDKKAGVHATGMDWSFLTKDKDIAIKTAKSHIE